MTRFKLLLCFFIVFTFQQFSFAQTTAKEWVEKAMEYSGGDSFRICLDKAIERDPNHVDAYLKRSVCPYLGTCVHSYDNEFQFHYTAFAFAFFNEDVNNIIDTEDIDTEIKERFENSLADLNKVQNIVPSKSIAIAFCKAVLFSSGMFAKSKERAVAEINKLKNNKSYELETMLFEKIYNLGSSNLSQDFISTLQNAITRKLKFSAPDSVWINAFYPDIKQAFWLDKILSKQYDEEIQSYILFKKDISMEGLLNELIAYEYLKIGDVSSCLKHIQLGNGIINMYPFINFLYKKQKYQDIVKIFNLFPTCISGIHGDFACDVGFTGVNSQELIIRSLFEIGDYKKYLSLSAKHGGVPDKRNFNPEVLYRYTQAWYKEENLENALAYLESSYIKERKEKLQDMQKNNNVDSSYMDSQVKLHYVLFDMGVQNTYNSDTSINLTIQFLQELSRKRPERSDYCKTTIADLRAKSMKYHLESCEKAAAQKDHSKVYASVRNAENMYKELKKYKLEGEYTKVLSNIYASGIKVYAQLAKEQVDKKIYDPFYAGQAIAYFEAFKALEQNEGSQDFPTLLSDTYALGAVAYVEKGNTNMADRWSKESLALNPSNEMALDVQKKLGKKAVINSVKQEAKTILKGLFKKN